MIRRQFQHDSTTFDNVMGGVTHRLNYISQNPHLRRIFNNTENQFDFREVLDDNQVILFDLGDLRDEAARIMTGMILTNLDDALKDRKRDLTQYSDDYVVNLLVDEAARGVADQSLLLAEVAFEADVVEHGGPVGGPRQKKFAIRPTRSPRDSRPSTPRPRRSW